MVAHRLVDHVPTTDAEALARYCLSGSEPPSCFVEYQASHRAFRVHNQTGKVFTLLDIDVAGALDTLLEAGNPRVLRSYNEKPVREEFRRLLRYTAVGSLSESQTKPTWDVLRIAGSYWSGLPQAGMSWTFFR